MKWKQALQAIRYIEEKALNLNKRLKIMEISIEKTDMGFNFDGIKFKEDINGVISSSLPLFFDEVEKVKSFFMNNEILDTQEEKTKKKNGKD